MLYLQQKKRAEESRFKDVEAGKPAIFGIAKQMRWDNQDTVGDNCVKNDLGNLTVTDDDKKVAWREHYECLL